MHVVSERTLRDFWNLHPSAETPLRAWHRIVRLADWCKFSDVRDVYPNADRVGKFTVFNVGGNKFRLIASIHFNRGKVYVRHVMTHEEYDEGKWKEDGPSKDKQDHVKGKDPPSR